MTVSLPLGKPSPSLQTIVTLHHTSISNLTRNLMCGAKRALPQMIPRVTSSAESLIQTQCQRYLTIKLQSRLSKSWGWKSNNCTLGSDVIWVSVNEANSNWRAHYKFKRRKHTFIGMSLLRQKQQDFISQVQGGLLHVFTLNHLGSRVKRT